MGYNFRVFETVKSKVKDTTAIPIVPGRYLICTDSGDVYYDTADSVRKHLTDIIDLETEAERQAILAPLDKFYFVKETATFWRFLGSSWMSLSSSGGSDAVYAILSASGWVDRQQSISVSGLGANQNGIMGVTQDVSAQEMDAACNGQLFVCGQADGQVTVVANGDVPTCDIPVVIILFS